MSNDSNDVYDVPDSDNGINMSIDTESLNYNKFNNIINNIDDDDEKMNDEQIINTEIYDHYRDKNPEELKKEHEKMLEKKELIDRYHLLEESIGSIIPKLFSIMIFLNYKNTFLRFSYKLSSILIIIFSSVMPWSTPWLCPPKELQKGNILINTFTQQEIE